MMPAIDQGPGRGRLSRLLGVRPLQLLQPQLNAVQLLLEREAFAHGIARRPGRRQGVHGHATPFCTVAACSTALSAIAVLCKASRFHSSRSRRS